MHGAGATDRTRMSRTELDARFEEIRTRFLSDPRGFRAEGALCQLADTALRAAWNDESGLAGASVLAVGGYGRGTLSPGSDLDFLFVFDGPPDPGIVRGLLGRLADMPFPLGHQAFSTGHFDSFRPVEASGYATFLESRYLFGDRRLARRFSAQVLPDLLDRHRAEFLESLVASRRERLAASVGRSLEPDLKDGAGGLRDYHWIRWTLRAGGDAISIADVEYAALHDAADFLVRVRNALQFLSRGRGNTLEERFQGPVAEVLGYGAADLAASAETLMAACASSAELIRDSATAVEQAVVRGR
jgi:[protein-PII] uridylyltransferase